MQITDLAQASTRPHSLLDDALSGSLREALGFEPEDLVAIARMADHSMVRGDSDLAVRAYALLVLVEPRKLAYQAGLARCALSVGAPDAALQAASVIVAATPDNPIGYFLSGRACFAMGLVAEAREDLEDAARLAKEARDGELYGQCQQLLEALA